MRELLLFLSLGLLLVGRFVMAVALIALGSNLGDRAATLERALDLLNGREDTCVISRSRFLETLPIGGPIGGPIGQREFLNGAALLDTALSPDNLLAHLQRVEESLGRTRDVRWGARTLDLDLLLYEQIVRDDPQITLPHPRMAFRQFVLGPAAEIAAEMVHPQIGWTVQQLLDHLICSHNYLAVTGPPCVGKRRLVEAVGVELGSRIVLDALGRNDSPPSGGFQAENGFQAEKERIGKRAEHLARLTNRGSARPESSCPESNRPESKIPESKIPDALMLSNFWLGQSLAYAQLTLPEADQDEIHETWNAARRLAPQPRLVVLLDTTWDQVADRSPLERSAWEQIRAALLEIVESGGHGPILRLDAGDFDRATCEVIAAARAMQPILSTE